MTVKECYELIGADYEGVKQRLSTDERIQKFFLMFTRDPSYAELTAAMDTGDVQTVFRMAHTLKGIAANIGLTELSVTSSELCEAVRGGSMGPEVPELYAAVGACYEKTIAAAERLREEANA